MSLSQSDCRVLSGMMTTTIQKWSGVIGRQSSLFRVAYKGLKSRLGPQAQFKKHCHAASAGINETQQGWNLEDHGAPESAYIHLPFCKRRCYYCDFPIQAVGMDTKRPSVEAKMDSYVDVLCQEIYQWESTQLKDLHTVFFGGGTPSLIPPKLLKRVLDALREKFGLQKHAEISMEADPGTFDQAKLSDYMSLGINRFSIGVQAFQEEALVACGRSHSLQDVRTAIADMHEMHIKNWSLDLISGLPNVSLQDWEASLQSAVEAEPPHISVYDLQVEEKTKFGRIFSPGQFPLPEDDVAADMYAAASRILQGAGMEHYEVSSYAKPNHRCQHNMVYWSGKPYLAFGLGAASYTGYTRFSRPKSMAAYKGWVADLVSGKAQGPQSVAVDPEEILLDRIMLSLRQSDGLDMAAISHDFGKTTADKISAALQRHISGGLVETGQHRMRLRDPEGFLMSNTIISDVFSALD